MMAGIRGKDTKPELVLRKGLHRIGFRYQLHRSELPGKPDMVFAKHRAVLFVHGCFWHKHNCHLFKWPQSRADFWKAKIEGNRARDAAALDALAEAGWRVGIIWECAVKGRTKLPLADILKKCEVWLRSSDASLEVKGIEARPPV
jgi:DNA mismatch endonuclease (patch repair protein)